eukprot:TRINITY_DN349_c0_g1_i5.p1 TRINITY_DN349_c0_g1~~TRINITY_DN349_c0_g1_i5.p1  ORF type:complete len:841 (-),score=235.56 TRINITY_DN349_c0_g1_i5:1003-3525(-)
MTAQGQTFNDRILAAKHSIAGQGLAKAVCKATTEEIIGPKKKHLDYLLHCTNEPNVSIPTLANLLIERTQNPNWVVVFKSLITTHHLMCYGNERFTQYLASSSSNFQLNSFLDKGGVQGYDMSPFIRRYAKYMSEKSKSYRNVAFDFCKVKRGKDGGTLRQMTGEKLLKTLPHLQAQIDSLLEFDCSAQDLNNGVINACFMLLFRDLIRLFACYNDGIINLLEKYFEMNKKQAREALDIYKKFLLCMDRVAEFLKVAESVGIDKGDIPDLTRAPSSLLEALEAHLASLEGRKPGSGGTTPTGNTRMNVAAVVNSLANASNAFGAASGDVIDEKTAARLLQEEEAAMEKFRSTASANNPFAAADNSKPAAGAVGGGAAVTAAAAQPEETPNILDLFGVAAPTTTTAPAAAAAPPPMAASSAVDSSKASDDLLQLSGNPFANMLNAAGSGQPIFPNSGAPTFNPQSSGFASIPSNPNNFTNENAFNNVFGQPGTNGATNVLQPQGSSSADNQAKMITGDLDSSLANLASNLNFGNQSRGGLVAQPKGPPMAGLNTMQSQPMATSSSSSQLLATSPAPSTSGNTLPPSQSFPAGFPPTSPGGGSGNPVSSSASLHLATSPSLPTFQEPSSSSLLAAASMPASSGSATLFPTSPNTALSPAGGGMAASSIFSASPSAVNGGGSSSLFTMSPSAPPTAGASLFPASPSAPPANGGTSLFSASPSGAGSVAGTSSHGLQGLDFGGLGETSNGFLSTGSTGISQQQQDPFGQDLFFNNNNNTAMADKHAASTAFAATTSGMSGSSSFGSISAVNNGGGMTAFGGIGVVGQEQKKQQSSNFDPFAELL